MVVKVMTASPAREPRRKSSLLLNNPAQRGSGLCNFGTNKCLEVSLDPYRCHLAKAFLWERP